LVPPVLKVPLDLRESQARLELVEQLVRRAKPALKESQARLELVEQLVRRESQARLELVEQPA
jgi:hypothetical protein